MKTGIEIITDERKRQLTVKGWSLAHDDGHKNGELVKASACYSLWNWESSTAFRLWPFDKSRIKIFEDESITDKMKRLGKAGAFIAAEIDRLQRLK